MRKKFVELSPEPRVFKLKNFNVAFHFDGTITICRVPQDPYCTDQYFKFRSKKELEAFTQLTYLDPWPMDRRG